MLLHYSKTVALSLLVAATVQGGVAAQGTSDTSVVSTFEIDVVFPRSNTTYNLTEEFPIVFAIQNISSILSDKAALFKWSIQKWGNVGKTLAPREGDVDAWTGSFTAGESLPDPYFVINTTNIYGWSGSYGPYFPNGSVYSLTWNVQWTTGFSDGASCTHKLNGSSFFNINLNDANPDLLALPTCPELGTFFELETDATITSGDVCPTVATPTASGDPCAVTVNQAAASSISNVISSLAAASVAATATTTSPKPTSSSGAAGQVAVVPVRSVLVAISVVVLLRLA